MYQPFATSLRAILRLKGWQDRRLAVEVGVSRSTVSRWLSGQQEPRKLTDFVNAVRVLGVTADELLGLTSQETGELVRLFHQLPMDLREDFSEKLRKMVEDYQKT